MVKDVGGKENPDHNIDAESKPAGTNILEERDFI
jgi:hypothetical protein